MSREARNTLLPTTVILAAIFFGTGLLGYFTHHLDTPSTVLLILVFVFGSLLVTWLTVVDDRKTRASLLVLRADLEEVGLYIIKQKSDSYDVIDVDSPTPGHEPIIDGLSLTELEAWVNGLLAGIHFYDAGEDDIGMMEARLAAQEQQHLEDRAHIGTFGQYIPDEDIPGYDGIYEVDALLRENGIERDAGKKPYFCVSCYNPLSFPEAFFYLGKTYCHTHLPEYSKESEQW